MWTLGRQTSVMKGESSRDTEKDQDHLRRMKVRGSLGMAKDQSERSSFVMKGKDQRDMERSIKTGKSWEGGDKETIRGGGYVIIASKIVRDGNDLWGGGGGGVKEVERRGKIIKGGKEW